MTLHEKTPVRYAHNLSKKLQKSIYFKMDCYQPTGSFKIRGVGLRCQEAYAKGAEQFVIASGGNAGLATAYAGWKLGVPTTVVVPTTTTVSMRNKIIALGATLKVFGDVWNESNAYAQSLVQKEQAVYIPPFDHPTIWKGNASVIVECVEQMEEPDAIIVAVGGGGYFCGVMQGLEQYEWKRAQVIAAETTGAASLGKALAAKERITLSEINTIASSLGAKQVAKQAFDWAIQQQTVAYTVSDKEALKACKRFLNDTGSLVEPACGAALAAVYQNLPCIHAAQRVLVLVCGGTALNLEQFNNYLITKGVS